MNVFKVLECLWQRNKLDNQHIACIKMIKEDIVIMNWLITYLDRQN